MAELLYLLSYQFPMPGLLSGNNSSPEIPLNWILAGALIVLLVGLIFEQIKKLFKKKKK